MVRKTLSMTIVEDIILENVSFKDPSISFLEKLDHYMRYNIYGLKTALATFLKMHCWGDHICSSRDHIQFRCKIRLLVSVLTSYALLTHSLIT